MTQNQKLLGWVADMQKICKPDAVVWINGSKEQLDALRAEACATGEIAPLNQEKLPAAISTAPRSTTLQEWSTELSYAPVPRATPAPQTTGWIPKKLMR